MLKIKIKNTNLFILEIIFYFLSILILPFTIYQLLFTNIVFAQTNPEFLVSWRALNYVPADYQGKILPSKSSPVEIGFDLIDKNRIVDLSKNKISWFLGENLLASGAGLKTIRFNQNSSLNQTIRITVSDYQGRDIDQLFLLPVSNPEIIIDTKTPTKFAKNKNALSLKNYTFEARPFFFNVSSSRELNFWWRLNNQPVAGTADNPEFLNLNLESPGQPAETELTVSVGVQNIFNQLELGSRLMNFIVK